MTIKPSSGTYYMFAHGDAAALLREIKAESEHPNVYPNPSELGWDKLEWPKLPKTAAERMREMRSRKPKTAAQWVESLVHKPV